LKIRDHVEVLSQPTVVRLEHLQMANAGWISANYYITEETGKHFKALRSLFAKENGCGAFLIGHYGSGKSHFLAYLTQQIQSGAFSSRGQRVLPISLLNYKASMPLEEILDAHVAVSPDQNDRRKKWKQVETEHPNGLVLILDELSEFLRSKPNAQSFNEDLRFLQFLGEWAQDHPLWILAALQEQIEHTGEIEYDLFRKIKDRYPIRLLLTPAHVKNLISESILRKKESFRPAVEKLAQELSEIYPKKSVDYGLFCEIYPIHPVTLELLEEVRDRFSQSRGIVDFTLTQLLGNEARNIDPFLDRPWGSLLTPDAIVDHFSDLFEVQPEFLAIAQKVLPYYRKHIPDLFPNKLQRELAWRTLKLLILVHLSPRRNSLTAEEASRWLLLKVSSIDPARNREIIEKILETLCLQGAFLKRQDLRYRLDLEDDSKEQLEQLLSRTVEELKGREVIAFENLVPLLNQSEFSPFALPRDRWFVRKIRWHFHEWDLNVYFGGGVPKEMPDGLALQIGVPWGPPAAAVRCYRVLPRQLELDPDVLDISALQDLKERPLSSRVLTRIQERLSGKNNWFQSLIRNAYHDANCFDPVESKILPPPASLPGNHISWLNALGEWILRQTYPLFEQFAPGHGPLPKEAYRQFMKFASEHDIGAEEAPEPVRLIREAYLVPMGIMQRRGSEYAVKQRLDNHELVQMLAPLIEHHPAPERVYQRLSAPLYGLVDDQIHLLLIMLLIQGEIDIVKADRSYREVYETLIHPLQYDKILPGRALNVNQLHDLQTLCDGFRIAVPRQWSVLAQKRAIEQLRKTGDKQRDQLSKFASMLKGQGEVDDLAQQVERTIEQWLALDKGEHELQGFQHFLFAIGSPERFIAEANEMTSMPARYERLLRETGRYRHLFSYEAVSKCADPGIAARVEALGPAPALSQPELLEAWLKDAQRIYQGYRDWYQVQHDRSWKKAGEHPIWTYKIPGLARSRHFAGSDTRRALENAIAEAKTGRCAGLITLDFQPVCRCGFDGSNNPLHPILSRFEELSSALERDLSFFFQQDQVKAKVREWAEQGLEMNTGTLSYVEGRAAYPEIENMALFDQHLAGLELVHPVETKSLMDLLGKRVWEKSALIQALGQLFDRYGPRISFRNEQAPPREDLVAWCCEQAMRQGQSLPKGLTALERSLIPGLLKPHWVQEKSFQQIESMDLGEDAILRVLEMLLSGAIRPPVQKPANGPVAAVLELMDPSRPASADELADLIACLYEQSDRLMKLRPKLWLTRLQQLAEIQLEKTPAPLIQLLQSHLDAQWIVVDCLGLPLVKAVASVLPQCFPHWRANPVQYATVSKQTSTEAFYLGLIGGDLRKAFEKMDVVDALIHERKLNLKDLAKLARAEMEVAFRRILERFDPGQSVLIFGDHGFRLALDGAGFCHGGSSTLERITPVFELLPRK
jgi:hypothetical protein